MTSEDIVFLIVRMLMLSVVGIKLVPLFKSLMMSGGRLMSVNLCNSLVDVIFSSAIFFCNF